MKMHILDANEVDVVGVTPFQQATIPNPFGPVSANQKSVAKTFTYFSPPAHNSSSFIPASTNTQVFTLTLHAKNTTTFANNNDVDITMMFSEIIHANATELTALHPSSNVYVPSSITNTGQFFHSTETFNSFFILPQPPASTTGHWLHILTPIGVRIKPSHFFARPINTATIGIQHVPVPPAALLAFPGLAMVWRGYRKRRKRMTA